MTTAETPRFDEWCVLELFGHRKLAGRVTEATWPAGFVRLDIPGANGTFATQLYAPSAVYAITPTTEELARRFAERHQPQPVTRWELPAAAAPEREDFLAEPDDPDDEDGDPELREEYVGRA